MARGVTLGSLLTKLRSEAQLSQNVAHNQQVRDEQVILLQRLQEWLWEDYAWPHLRVRRQDAFAAGARTIAPPTDVRVDRIEMIEVRDGGIWTKLKTGIGPEHYAIYDSDLDQRGWPVERWRIDENEQIELWPIPSANGSATTLEGYYRITGIRNLGTMTADAHTADLDDRLLTLYGASELLSSSNPALAGIKQKAANTRLRTLRGNMSINRKFSLAGREPVRELRGPPTTYYRTS